MGATLLTFALVVVVLSDALGFGRPATPWTAEQWLTQVLGPMIGVLAIAFIGMRRYAYVIDTFGDVRAIGRSERLLDRTRIALVMIHIVGVLYFGSLASIRASISDLVLIDELLVLSPLLAAWVATIAMAYPIERRVREARLLRDLESGAAVYPIPTLRSHVMLTIRNQVLFVVVPMLLLLSWAELCERFPPWREGGPSFGLPEWARGAAVRTAVQIAGAVGILAIMPLVLRALWQTSSMRAGELRSSIERICGECRVKIRDVLVWRTGGTTMNAAAIGLIAPLRYVVISDGLLDRLSPARVEAVAAHEIGHVRCHHLAWLAASALASILIVSAVIGVMLAVGASMPPVRATLMLLAPGIEAGGAVVSLAVTAVVVGWISRRFERQADAFAAKHVSVPHDGERHVTREGVMAIAGALAEIASTMGISPSRFTWRHGSIAGRVEAVLRLEGHPVHTLPIDRLSRAIKSVVLVSLVVSCAALWWADREIDAQMRSRDGAAAASLELNDAPLER